MYILDLTKSLSAHIYCNVAFYILLRFSSMIDDAGGCGLLRAFIVLYIVKFTLLIILNIYKNVSYTLIWIIPRII